MSSVQKVSVRRQWCTRCCSRRAAARSILLNRCLSRRRCRRSDECAGGAQPRSSMTVSNSRSIHRAARDGCSFQRRCGEHGVINVRMYEAATAPVRSPKRIYQSDRTSTPARYVFNLGLDAPDRKKDRRTCRSSSPASGHARIAAMAVSVEPARRHEDVHSRPQCRTAQHRASSWSPPSRRRRRELPAPRGAPLASRFWTTSSSSWRYFRICVGTAVALYGQPSRSSENEKLRDSRLHRRDSRGDPVSHRITTITDLGTLGESTAKAMQSEVWGQSSASRRMPTISTRVSYTDER